MEKFSKQADAQNENSGAAVEQTMVREKSTPELFAIRLMEDELKSYEENWKFDGTLESAAKKNIDTMRSTLREGDYTLVLGQLLSEKGSLLKSKAERTADPKFDVDARMKDIDRIITTLGYQEFPEAKEVTADDAATYLDVRASKLAEFARLNKKSGGDIESFKREMEESERYRRLANEINEAVANNKEVSEETRQKAYDVFQKEMGFRSRTAGRPYLSIANGEGNLGAYRNPANELTRDAIEELKQEIEQALSVEAMGNLFKKVSKHGEKTEAEERKLEQLRFEINNMTINGRGRTEEAIKPMRLTNVQRGEIFKRFFERRGNDYVARSNALEVAVSETEVKNFIGDILGTIEKIKQELREVQKQRPNVRTGSNVASILGNNGADVVMLQILLAKKEDRIRSLNDIIAMDLKTALKQATGYEIADPEYDNFFAR